MRTAFIDTLTNLAQKNDKIWLLCGDLGYSVLEKFALQFPNRYVNVGIAEQNMAGVAAGLALCGKVVFIYSIANFPTLRCLEQIRNDICYHKANVKIVAVGGGFTYGAQGYTHHGTEDLAIMRTLPNMTVIAPGDPLEAAEATKAIAGLDGPCYLRLGKAGEPVIHGNQVNFEIGKAIMLKDGRDVTLISSGNSLQSVTQAAKELEDQGISARILSMHTLKPIDTAAIIKASAETSSIISVEEHGVIGGLGSAIAEVLAKSRSKVAFESMGIKEIPVRVGDQEFLRRTQNLDVASIVNCAKNIIKVKTTLNF
jgi:transketolase